MNKLAYKNNSLSISPNKMKNINKPIILKRNPLNNLNIISQNDFTNQLYDVLRQIKELNLTNIENKKSVLKFQQEYNNMQSILLSAIENII